MWKKTYASKTYQRHSWNSASEAVITGRRVGTERAMGRQEETAQKQSQELRDTLRADGQQELTGRRAVSGSGPEHLVLLIRIQLNRLSAIRENYSSTQVSNSK